VNRNYNNCKCFGYMARHYRNRRTKGKIRKGRKLEYRGNKNNGEKRIIEGENGQNNLNGDKDLIVLN